jgi:hypothetical protein
MYMYVTGQTLHRRHLGSFSTFDLFLQDNLRAGKLDIPKSMYSDESWKLAVASHQLTYAERKPKAEPSAAAEGEGNGHRAQASKSPQSRESTSDSDSDSSSASSDSSSDSESSSDSDSRMHPSRPTAKSPHTHRGGAGDVQLTQEAHAATPASTAPKKVHAASRKKDVPTQAEAEMILSLSLALKAFTHDKGVSNEYCSAEYTFGMEDILFSPVPTREMIAMSVQNDVPIVIVRVYVAFREAMRRRGTPTSLSIFAIKGTIQFASKNIYVRISCHMFV